MCVAAFATPLLASSLTTLMGIAAVGAGDATMPSGLKRNLLPIIWSFVGLLALAALIVVTFLLRRRAQESKELMIIATKPKEIRYSLSNTTSTIERCFSQVGYAITRIKTFKALERRIAGKAPDVVLVDWAFDANVADEVEIILVVNPRTMKVPIIYYDVPNPAKAAERKARLPHAYYLGPEFTDRDVFKIVQQHTQGTSVAAIQRKGDDGSSLEGDISGEEGLGAVLQLLEIGQKSGCLLVRRESPVGVIYFEAGNPVYARTSAQLGEKAVYELLDLKSGGFRFMTDQKASERNCSITTMGVLMEWARLKDEARKR
jgi:hypothetical protein